MNQKKVLIIEDDDIFRGNIFDFLELENFQVLSAADGEIGLELVKEQQPDLILCDINMPNINGYQVLKKLRENSETANLPFIFITESADYDSRSYALQLGANGYLNKTVSLKDLLVVIEAELK